MLYWYVAHVKCEHINKFINALNRHDDIETFIPKKERWFGRGSYKPTFLIKELYQDYMFIKNYLDKEFKQFFGLIKGLVDVLDFKDICPLKVEERFLLEKLLDDEDTRGKIVDKQFAAIDGPLVGLKDMILKVNKHDRNATFVGKLMVAMDYVY